MVYLLNQEIAVVRLGTKILAINWLPSDIDILMEIVIYIEF